MYFVYVLHSKSFDKIYIGYSSDVTQRLLWHNQLAKKGWTLKFRPWDLIYTETFKTKSEALKREQELKSSRGRAFIREKLLQNR